MKNHVEHENLFIICWLIITGIPFLFSSMLYMCESVGVIKILYTDIVITLFGSSTLSFFAIIGLLIIFSIVEEEFDTRVNKLATEIANEKIAGCKRKKECKKL